MCPVNMLGKAAEDSPSSWTLASWERQGYNSGFQFGLPPAVMIIWVVNQWTEDLLLHFFLSLCTSAFQINPEEKKKRVTLLLSEDDLGFLEGLEGEAVLGRISLKTCQDQRKGLKSVQPSTKHGCRSWNRTVLINSNVNVVSFSNRPKESWRLDVSMGGSWTAPSTWMSAAQHYLADIWKRQSHVFRDSSVSWTIMRHTPRTPSLWSG